MSRLLDDFARRHPSDASFRGSEWFISAERVGELLDEAQLLGVHVLGLEGFLIDDRGTYPSLSRLADFSNDPPEAAVQRARELLAGAWATPPTSSDQMNSAAVGRHMLAVVLDD